ncbi:7-deoxyloganetin glucosyltransferase [Camellia lanceoleosa]|uniref:7-deoxyloganetin glucosyltransferase n=1 Tax=Camellia lanceoleosa TaxID=1840588 RepID=A0ACC0IJ06_9ERIC|nr:7-deoxyloganetin glucosyltransferase [Camellia lanceoleosa]
MNNIRLKDLPTFIRTTGNDPNHFMLNFLIREIDRTNRASAIVINTFHALERAVVNSLSSTFIPPLYTIGPLHLMLNNQISADDKLKSIGSNLWKEDPECVDWLNSQQPNSVVYVNFGSITVMTAQQLTEFAWGLAKSEKNFLWIIRPDIVSGDTAILPPEFVPETKDRGVLASWCPQEQVLNHPAIGGFLTHSGWNSTIESVSGGVPIICWPFFAEQQTNCWYSRGEWGIGLEIDSDVKREEVEKLVRELMGGEKGKEMKKKAMEWKKAAEEATRAGGSSFLNFDKLLYSSLDWNSLSRIASRSNLLSRGLIGQANISSRASPIAKPNDSPYYIGLDRVSEDSCNSLKNPNGTIHLGLSENRLSLDLIEKWFLQNFNDSILGGGGRGGNRGLSISGIATYQSFDGMPERKEIQTN